MKRKVGFMQNNNSPKNPVVPILMIAFVAIWVYVMGVQTYKSETFTCDRTKNSCEVTRINYFNQSKKENLTNTDNISQVLVGHYKKVKSSSSSRKRKFSSSSSRREYDRYSVFFKGKDGQKGIIFQNYSHKPDAERDAKAIYELLKSGKSVIKYEKS